MAVELLGVHALAIGDGVGLAGAIEAGAAPSVFVGLDHPGRAIFGILVGVDVEPAVLVRPEDESEGIERPRRAEPDELGLARVNARLEVFLVALAHETVDAVGADDEVGIAQLLDVADLALVMDDDAKRGAALRQDVQQHLA